MNELNAWKAAAVRVGRYLLSRYGLATCPPFDDIYPEGLIVFKRIYRWHKRMRIVGAEKLPDAPIVFASNHVRFDDPIVMWVAISVASNQRYYPRFMMRTDAFRDGTILKSRILDIDELAELVAAMLIDRDHVTLRQLKPFVKRLRDHKVFGIYIGRTRSRSGMVMEYREFDEPGSATFFMVQAQNNRPELNVAAIPLTRTFNIVTKRSTFIFGDPLYVDTRADRQTQRNIDFELIQQIANQVEINVPQLLALVVYLHVLHNLGDTTSLQRLKAETAAVFRAADGHYIDPAARADFDKEFKRALRFFEKRDIIQHYKDDVALASDVVRRCPPLDRSYKDLNPIKFLANQILHFPDLVGAAETAVLGLPEASPVLSRQKAI